MSTIPDIHNTHIHDNQTKRTVAASELVTLRFAGWQAFQDARYTSTSPLTIPTGTETRLIFDRSQLSFVQEDYRPLVRSDGIDLWDFDNNLFNAEKNAVGTIYKVRLQCSARATTSGTGIALESIIRIPSSIAIVREMESLNKGTTPQRISFSTEFYITQNEVDNGLELYLEAIGQSVEVYNINILIKSGD